MTENHPITPPLELVKKWIEDWAGAQMKGIPSEVYMEITAQAARWGADQELEACCEWLEDPDLNVDTYKLRAARRPKPLGLKEQALEALDRMDQLPTAEDHGVIRRALESLP